MTEKSAMEGQVAKQMLYDTRIIVPVVIYKYHSTSLLHLT